MIGIILPYGGSVAPNNYLMCDGSAISRTTYSKLFAVIGTNFGGGDNSTTFNLPDLREAVPKGTGLSGKSSTHYDSDGLSLGEFIEDRNKSHSHTLRAQNTNTTFYNVVTTTTQSTLGNTTSPRFLLGSGAAYTGLDFSSSGSETNEVKSVGVNYISKYQ